MTKSAQKNSKRWATPDTLSDAIDMLADLRETVEELERQVESISADSDDFEERANTAEARADEAESALAEESSNIARVVIKIKAGRIDDALYDLENVLQTIDPRCKARTSAVAVLI